MTVQQLADALGAELPPMNRAELWWCAWLWLSWSYIEELKQQFYRDLYAHYNSASARRIEALAMRDTPFMRAIREQARAD